MIFMHQQNLEHKIKSNYKNLSDIIKSFFNNKYLIMRNDIESLDFNSGNLYTFQKATEILNQYYADLISFAKEHNILAQSKFESTFLEEISVYLFKNLEEIKNGTYNIFNKGIYAGIKIDTDNKVEIIKKDVDFCIGKKVKVNIDNQPTSNLIIPIVAVEVKTYLDATMFGEVKSSSKAIRSASPNSKTYVLMGYKCLADEHIISARQDSALTEIFVLKATEKSPMDARTLYDYWNEIKNAINDVSNNHQISVPGRLFKQTV